MQRATIKVLMFPIKGEARGSIGIRLRNSIGILMPKASQLLSQNSYKILRSNSYTPEALPYSYVSGPLSMYLSFCLHGGFPKIRGQT